MAVNFASLLSKPLDQVERPKPKPAGTYFGTIREYKFEESKKQKTPYVRFIIVNASPGPDVDPSRLEGIDLNKWTPHRDFYLTTDAEYRLKEFIESLKIPTQGRTFQETIPETKGMAVMFTVTERPSEDGKEVYNDVTDLRGVD